VLSHDTSGIHVRGMTLVSCDSTYHPVSHHVTCHVMGMALVSVIAQHMTTCHRCDTHIMWCAIMRERERERDM